MHKGGARGPSEVPSLAKGSEAPAVVKHGLPFGPVLQARVGMVQVGEAHLRIARSTGTKPIQGVLNRRVWDV